MFRTTLLRAARATVVARPTVRLAVAVPRQVVQVPRLFVGATRAYSAPAGLNKEEVEGRIKDLLKGFDKVTDSAAITGTSHFSKDLGLDSLDTVEVVMAIEEEFSIEIPDKEADKILSVEQAVNYILSRPDAH